MQDCGDIPGAAFCRTADKFWAVQVLTSRYSRRLIIMEKTRPLKPHEVTPAIDPQIEADLASLANAVWETRETKPLRPKYRGKLC